MKICEISENSNVRVSLVFFREFDVFSLKNAFVSVRFIKEADWCF